MNKLISVLTLVLALSLTACSGGGGGSKVDNNGGDSSGNGSDSNGSVSGGSGDLNSDGTGSDGVVSPSNTPSPVGGNPDQNSVGGIVGSGDATGGSGAGSDNEDRRFANKFVSNDDFDFWGCVTRESDNAIFMFLYDTTENGKIGLFGVQPRDRDITSEDFFEITWDANGGNLDITFTEDGSSLTYANYQFEEDYLWGANLQAGEFADDVACGLFNQNGEFVGDLDPQGTDGGDTTDPADAFVTYFNSDTDFGQWGCFAQEFDNVFAMILTEDENGSKIGAFRINDADFFPVTWDADETTLVIQDSDGGTARFSDYSFDSDILWQASITLGNYEDEVACGLFDQDGQRIQ